MSESKGAVGKLEDALIIFVKNPVPGQVKTRLARSIGDQQAADVYKHLLAHTKRMAGELEDVQRLVYYADAVNRNDLWEEERYEKRAQNGADLGERMAGSIAETMGSDFKKVVIIGSDCLEIGAKHIRLAYRKLDEADVVIGPASDGGYYLLGMKTLHRILFEDIVWSSKEVFNITLEKINQLGLSYYLLEILSDIDDLEDYLKIKDELEEE
jgi:rSAM/selenodomain-associated transferase 1